MAKKRWSIPEEVLEQVLLDSRRRCCICYGAGNDEVREGAIAHIQAGLPEAEADTEANLVFLCQEHHSELDAGRISPERLRESKGELYRALREGRATAGGEIALAAYQYERHVFALLSAEFRKWFNGQVTIHEDGYYPGLTGTSPDVPFSADVSVAGIHIWLVGDAKYAERNIGLNDLRAFAAVVQYLKANKGIFVTNTGFSESALKFANEEGIALVLIKSEDRELKPGVIYDAIGRSGKNRWTKAPEEQWKRAEDAEKSSIIARDIILRLEDFNRTLTDHRKARLRQMTRDELHQLAQRLKGDTTGQEAITMIVEEITASEKARREG
jgi:hypothetical protein